MLCYCVDELQYFQPSNISHEEITGTHDLLAVLLNKSFEVLYKNGYLKEYNTISIVTDKPRGRLNIPKSIESAVYTRGSLNCKITNLDINNQLNQIIKSAFTMLIDTNNVITDKISKTALSQLYHNRELLRKVDDINIDDTIFDLMVDVPQWYKPIIIVCRLIINDWLASDETGEHRLLELQDEKRLCYIWQKYLIALCKKKLCQCKVSNPSFSGIKYHWNTDLVIVNKIQNIAIVADAKWYEQTSPKGFNVFEVNGYIDCFKEIETGYNDKNTRGLIIYASNETTHFGLTEVAVGKAITDLFINVNQDKDALESDIINCISNYMNPEYTN
jgi:5-methylcytosine-specific restriction enzyme subunit McrC